MLTRLCNLDLLAPLFSVENLRLASAYIIFLIFAQIINCAYMLPPIHILSKIRKQSHRAVKIEVHNILHRCVNVMSIRVFR